MLPIPRVIDYAFKADCTLYLEDERLVRRHKSNGKAMMKLILISGLALSAMTAIALAEPMKLTDAEMDKITAGATCW